MSVAGGGGSGGEGGGRGKQIFVALGDARSSAT